MSVGARRPRVFLPHAPGWVERGRLMFPEGARVRSHRAWMQGLRRRAAPELAGRKAALALRERDGWEDWQSESGREPPEREHPQVEDVPMARREELRFPEVALMWGGLTALSAALFMWILLDAGGLARWVAVGGVLSCAASIVVDSVRRR